MKSANVFEMNPMTGGSVSQFDRCGTPIYNANAPNMRGEFTGDYAGKDLDLNHTGAGGMFGANEMSSIASMHHQQNSCQLLHSQQGLTGGKPQFAVRSHDMLFANEGRSTMEQADIDKMIRRNQGSVRTTNQVVSPRQLEAMPRTHRSNDTMVGNWTNMQLQSR
mmetsp:Transcript_16264/g.27503  ORF Transcript_16264/g.27503 Transcript_16264/m.27503 type:complete len:164 (+) Transcript_16264:493-984(+)